MLETLRKRGLYHRPTEIRLGRIWDRISEAPCATEFAISRFLVPHLAKQTMGRGRPAGWALFVDCDVLVRANLDELFDSLDPRYAAYCVKHDYASAAAEKMDGQLQTDYPRKNWSSVMVWNCDHPANQRLTVEMVNSWRGRDLHALNWLADEEIGGLDPAWNWLVGEQEEPAGGAKIVHYTLGIPSLSAFVNAPYADEWRHYLHKWAA